ncbi:MAG TPA: hypothetical protein VFV19_01395 [Candidatus Polarisedimenticolaceae bacterium]|nr:hypothetical protein [Candidatus Polarisedimenticolaceae bacterium]
MRLVRAISRAAAAISILATVTLASAAVPYVLINGSNYEEGCFAPCACPVLIDAPLFGTLQMDFAGPGDTFDLYSIPDVHWFTANATTSRRITGSGTYKVGELSTDQDMELDLSIDGAALEHFSSGLVNANVPFPDLAVSISKHGGVCQDTVMDLKARPVPHLAVERDSLVWDGGLEIPGYDVVVGKLRDLRESGGDFSLAITRCAANDLHDHTMPFPDPTAADEAQFILVRAAGSTYDTFAPSQVRSRDAGIAASPNACP